MKNTIDDFTSRDRTIDGFCARHGFSRSKYYLDRARGLTPREYVVGKLVRISEEAEAAWVKAREADGDARRTALYGA